MTTGAIIGFAFGMGLMVAIGDTVGIVMYAACLAVVLTLPRD